MVMTGVDVWALRLDRLTGEGLLALYVPLVLRDLRVRESVHVHDDGGDGYVRLLHLAVC